MGDVVNVGEITVCTICHKRQAKLLCDMPTGIISTTSRKFGTFTATCDKEICSECAVEVRGGIHFCKDCVSKLKQII